MLLTCSPDVTKFESGQFPAMIMSIVRICTNIPVMALYIVGFLHLASFAGVQLFSAQYMQFQFGLEARITSLLLGQ